MRSTSKFAMVAAALLALGTSAFAQQPGKGPLQTGEAARPRDAGANKPSESGAQSTTRSGAATGAGQPQGPQAIAPGSAKAKTQAETPTGDDKLAKQTSKKKKQKRKHRAAKRTTDATTDAGTTPR